MIVLEAEIEITAPAARIWELLTDGASYAGWNPMLCWSAGALEIGSRPELTVTLPEIPPFTLRPTFLTLVPQKEIGWRHRLPVPGLASWTQSFTVEEISPEVRRVRQRVSLGGLLAPLYKLALGRMIQHGLNESNAALRRWAQKEIRCHRC